MVVAGEGQEGGGVAEEFSSKFVKDMRHEIDLHVMPVLYKSVPGFEQAVKTPSTVARPSTSSGFSHK